MEITIYTTPGVSLGLMAFLAFVVIKSLIELIP